MTEQQKSKMKTYIIPRMWIWNNKEIGMRSNMFIRLYAELAKHDYNSKVWGEILEDVIMETYQYAIRNDKFMAPNYFARRIKTYYFRELYKMDGLSQSGKPYKDPANHVHIVYTAPEDLNDGKYGHYNVDGEYEKVKGINSDPANWYKYEDENEEEYEED